MECNCSWSNICCLVANYLATSTANITVFWTCCSIHFISVLDVLRCIQPMRRSAPELVFIDNLIHCCSKSKRPHLRKRISWEYRSAPSSEFMSSSIPSWQILTAHAQPFRRARDLAFCLKIPLDSLLVWASSGGSGETPRMRRLAWTFAARIGNKY